jgi:protein O-mannosyl-transferase
MPATAKLDDSAVETSNTTPLFGKKEALICLLLVLCTLAVYSSAFRHGFISYDDDRYVTDNPQVTAGLRWSGVVWAFTTFEQANWHPLTWISHQTDSQFFHLNPAGHHATSIFLHAIDAVLLFLSLRWFTGSVGRSAIVASLFAVHPLNVESVAWVAERKSVLSMLFLLLAIAAYGWYARKPGIGRYALVMLLLAAGLMAKPMVITLPFLLLLLDYWPLERMRIGSDGQEAGKSFAWLCLEKVPLLVLSAASAVITMIVQRAGGAVISTKHVSIWMRIGNSILCYAVYIEKMFWPRQLAILYPYPHSLVRWQVALAAIFLAAVTWLVLQHRDRRYLVVGWFWYLGAMVPMIGLVQVGNQAMADRYAYLPMIGLFLMIVWGVADCARSIHLQPSYAAAAGVAAILLLGLATRAQLDYWRDDYTLWSHALQVTSQNFVAESNLGLALMREGRRDDAIAHFRTASGIEPGDPTSQFNLGVYAQEQGDWKQAAARYEAVLSLTPDKQLRASAYANLGTIYFSLRDYPRAKLAFESVLKLDRVFPIVLQDLGLIAQKNGDTAEAIRYFSELTTVDPSDIHFFLLAQTFHQAGRDADAVWAYQQAVRLSKDINQTRAAANQMEAL